MKYLALFCMLCCLAIGCRPKGQGRLKTRQPLFTFFNIPNMTP